jgi:hypothetical protein
MLRLVLLILASFGFCTLAAGCVPSQMFSKNERSPTEVPSSPFGAGATPPAPPRRTSFGPADTTLCARVDTVGRKVLAANPQIGMRPLFAAIGSPGPEIFHQGASIIYVTAGLVTQCKTEAQLAAVLSLELGKMVSERELLAPPESRDPQGLAPVDVPIGQAGNNSGPDLTHLAELARFEKAHPKARRRLPPPNPQVLAGVYLEKAGFKAEDLDSIAGILQTADRNMSWERQINGKAPQSQWAP